MLNNGEEHWGSSLSGRSYGSLVTEAANVAFPHGYYLPFQDQRRTTESSSRTAAGNGSSRVADKDPERMSLMSSLLHHASKRPSNDALNTLQSDSRSIIVAGSDTAAEFLKRKCPISFTAN